MLDWTQIVTAAIALLALAISIRERAGGPRTALFERRLDAVVEVCEAMWMLDGELRAWCRDAREDPSLVGGPLTPSGEAVDAATTDFTRIYGKWITFFDRRVTDSVTSYANAVADALQDPTKDDLSVARAQTVTDELARLIAVEPLSEALHFITGQAGRERQDSMREGYRQAGERLDAMRPRIGSRRAHDPDPSDDT